MEIFTVIAHRWGDDHNHSYFVGTYSTKELAYEMARAEEHWRAGKYECKILPCTLDDVDQEVQYYYRSECGNEPAPEGYHESAVECNTHVYSMCKTHPDAPHGFNRGASHAEGRYVCDCENWEPEEETPNPNIVDVE